MGGHSDLGKGKDKVVRKRIVRLEAGWKEVLAARPGPRADRVGRCAGARPGEGVSLAPQASRTSGGSSGGPGRLAGPCPSSGRAGGRLRGGARSRSASWRRRGPCTPAGLWGCNGSWTREAAALGQ